MILLRYFTLIIFLSAPFAAHAGVMINEIAWMGMQPKAGETSGVAANNEWFELYNSGSDAVSLEGWSIVADDGSPDIFLQGSVSAGGYFLLERTDDETVPGIGADQIYSGSFENGGEYLKLKNISGNVVDEINADSGWPAGDNITKDTMQRSGSSWITAPPTPRAQNAGNAVLSPAPLSSSSTSSHAPAPAAENVSSAPSSPFPEYKIYSGKNTTVAVGTLVEFVGDAATSKNELIENVRFLWNFGNGETKEGRAVNYIYQIPGKYTVGLHAAIGDRAVSDYHTVEVVPNQLTLGSVLEGEQGFIVLVNPSDKEIDIGSWLIDDGLGMRFVVPAHTKIAARSEIALANQTTKLLLGKTIYPLTLRFPNARIALQKFPPIAVAVPISPVASVQQKTQVVAIKPEVAPQAKMSPQRVEEPMPEQSQAEASSSASSTETQLASASQASSRGSLFWFAAAFAVSFACALGFIVFKRFL